MIDFGTSWPAFTDVGEGNYSAGPYDRVIGKADGAGHSTETELANLLNSVAGTTFAGNTTDIHKTNHPAELGGTDGYFSVPSGWKYLIAQYNGPNGGSVIIDLSGNDARVPYDSSLIWGDNGKYAISHFAVAGVVTPDPNPVPEGGMTLAMLGLGIGAMGLLRQKFGPR